MSAPRDRRRHFARSEVRRAWELQGRACKLCRRQVPVDLMHGDHIVPWAMGGLTVLANLQALCGSCNLRKGTRPQQTVDLVFAPTRLLPGAGPLRRWQEEAVRLARSHLLREHVLIEACPGAGKTAFALTIAHEVVATGAISRILIVVPTLGIVDGWRRAASAATSATPTLPLRSSRDWHPVDPIGDDWVGAVFTYQSLFAMTDMFLAHAADPGHRTLIIFDEVHHASVASGWGQAAQKAFSSSASAVLSLSGTPFRTDRSQIAFIPSTSGTALPHYRYSYENAIAEGTCRPVQFVEARGRTTYRTTDGVVHDVSFDDAVVSDGTARRRMRAALEWIEPGSIADRMLADANAYLVALRRAGDEDAAGLVVCVDCAHADRVAAHMSRHVLGTRPVVASSRLGDPDDPDPAHAIDMFNHGKDPWLVAVNMISEGVDIPRLRVVVYLTNRQTLLSFRQIVGRVVRANPRNPDDHGRVYLPADPRLLEMARHVTKEARLLPPPVVIETESVASPSPARNQTQFEVLRTVGTPGGAFDTAGSLASPELVHRARLFIEKEGLTATDAESLALLATQTPALLARILAHENDE